MDVRKMAGVAGVGLTLATLVLGGCGRPGEANADDGGAEGERVPLSVVNRSGTELQGLAVRAGSVDVSFGSVDEGKTEVVSLRGGLTASELRVTWRDAAGQRQYQTLAVGTGPVSGVSVTIDEQQKAILSIR